MYEQHYGLSDRPFQLTPDPQFYFESASHKKAMSYLSYGLNQGEGFIVITGEVGAGKSTLVAHLMERIDTKALTAAQVVTSALDGEELVHVVAQAFGLDIEGKDKASALGAIERFLQDEAREGRRCLLIVDECQNLDFTALEELRMLSNFQLGSHPLLQSLLLGQPQFRRTLAHHPDLEQLRQRIIASHHLDALKPDELEDYITHRLKQVGWDGRPTLGEGLAPDLFNATRGIPRRINQVMNRLLLLGAIEDEDTLSQSMLEAVCEEMMADQTRGAPSQASEPKRLTGPDVGTAQSAAAMSDAEDRSAELEAAIGELQAASALAHDTSQATDPEMSEAIERLEQRLEEQERSFRHVLTVLIEWLEDGNSREAA
ncbi:MAG: XrtA-associated ATPase [Erythrobacter sp.]|uniref:XrtA/PEP-CTERM system-associated ATPase n=1 Tax=Erythrobacter sp. TaxID=1042 RepID=UPI00262056CA|nr:XrtA/PEP-CTERM system-associated ATPase [Erythrobacter sp.]MDJ0977852.1 XrtA-associated ATPase [Erythrobacter sp.]